MTGQQDELVERFIYPKNALLRKSLQGIINTVLETRRIVFRPETLALAILNYHGWIDDSNLDTDKPPGANYKKALNILKTFEGTFTGFTGTGLGLEVFIYRTDKVRVKTFDELEQLCSLDPDMSEVVATTIKLDHSQKWEDKYVPDNPPNAVSITNATSEIIKMKSAQPLKKDSLDALVLNKPSSFRQRHTRPTKGSELSPEDLEEIKMKMVEVGS